MFLRSVHPEGIGQQLFLPNLITHCCYLVRFFDLLLYRFIMFVLLSNDLILRELLLIDLLTFNLVVIILDLFFLVLLLFFPVFSRLFPDLERPLNVVVDGFAACVLS